MVKGKVPVKQAAPNCKSTATTSKTAGNTPDSVSCQAPKKPLIQNVPLCSGCGNFITDETKALQCDKCQSVHGWKCAECLNLPSSVYDALMSENRPPLRWFCDECDESWKRPGAEDLMSAMAQLVDKLEQKLGLEITAIGTRLEGMEEKVELTSTTLNCKVDFLTSKLEEAMDSVVKTVTTQSKPESCDLQLLGEVQQRLEHKVDLLHTNIDEPVALAVHDVLQQDKAEELEIEKRKTNVIIHGLAESQDDSSDQRISDDLAVLSAMFHEAGVENAKVENVVRLGRRPSDPTQNPRPMKVVLD